MPITSAPRNAAMLGAVIYQARQYAGLTQEQLAARLGVSKQLVWDAENGRATKAIDRLFRIFDELDVTLTATIPERSTTDVPS